MLLHSNSSFKVIGVYAQYVLSSLAFILINRRYKLRIQYILVGLFTLTFLFQFIFSLNVYMTYENDLNFYFNNAVDFTRNGFQKPLLYQAVFPTTASYPAFLMPFMKLFGPNRMVPIVINQICMSCMSCMVFFFCKRSMSVTLSLAAAFSICLHPFTIIYSNTCNAELIFGVLVFAGFFASLKAKDAPGIHVKAIWIAFCAVLCAISNIFRPLGILLLIAIAIQIVIFSRNAPRIRAVLSAVLLISYFVVNLGCMMMQEYVTKYPPASNGFGWNLYIGASASGRWNQADADEFTQILRLSSSPSEVHSYFAKKGVERYLDMGLKTIPHMLRKLSPWYATEYIASEAVLQDVQSPFYTVNERGIYLALINIVDYPLFLLSMATCLWVLFSTLKTKEHESLPLVLYLLGSFLVLMVVEIAPRYTISYRPLFCVLSFYGIHLLVQARKSNRCKL